MKKQKTIEGFNKQLEIENYLSTRLHIPLIK